MDFIILKTSGTRHIVGNLITATYITIAVARILVVSIWFSPASERAMLWVANLLLHTWADTMFSTSGRIGLGTIAAADLDSSPAGG